MGLLSYYDDRNKVENQLLTIWLRQEQHVGDIYKFSRIATKNYSYIGMDKATATSCLYEKQAKYKYYENVNAIISGDLSVLGQELKDGADVAASHDGGGMWHVDINVNINDHTMFKYEGTPTVEYINSKFSLNDFDEDSSSGNHGQIYPSTSGSDSVSIGG